MDQDIDYEKGHMNIILAHKASEPLDILWRNMGFMSSHFIFTRFFMFVLVFVMIIFLSSPAVMVKRLKNFESLSWLSFGWTDDMGTFGTLLHKSGPPMLILVINVTIISLLDFICVIESYDSHSQYQNNVYLKTVVYTSLNMFIIPVLTTSGGASMYDLIINSNFNVAKILGELFIPKSGEFFALLLV